VFVRAQSIRWRPQTSSRTIPWKWKLNRSKLGVHVKKGVRLHRFSMRRAPNIHAGCLSCRTLFPTAAGKHAHSPFTRQHPFRHPRAHVARQVARTDQTELAQRVGAARHPWLARPAQLRSGVPAIGRSAAQAGWQGLPSLSFHHVQQRAADLAADRSLPRYLAPGLGPLVLQAAGAGVELGVLAGKSGGVFRLMLRAVEPMEREGELALQLLLNEELVCSCAFVLIDAPAGFDVGVGCNQGPRSDAGLSIMREATRQLHGLRPKSLLIKLLCALGYRYGCDGLRLVGNGNRTVRGAIRQGKVHADYDTLWRECGAIRRDDGDFYLRCAPLEPPDLPAMASSKRSGARHRHEVVRQLVGLVSARLDDEGPPPLVASIVRLPRAPARRSSTSSATTPPTASPST